MKRILLTLSYDGTAYHGWQIQPNAITVQETVQDALFKLLGSPHGVTGCSRTDAGVHAREFCCHIDCDDNIPDAAFLRGLNSLLPSDIAVKDCKEVALDFHARYNAKGKTYKYRILNSSIKDPFLSRYFWQIERKLNVDKMNEFCEKIVGTHDFYAFSSSGRTVEDTVRTITECYVERDGDEVTLTVSANGFLYNMVRIIAGTAVEVSDGRINLQDTLHILDLKNRDMAGITAPPNALMLWKVHY
jgi:tRNA pseudouridine38-40 synthase